MHLPEANERRELQMTPQLRLRRTNQKRTALLQRLALLPGATLTTRQKADSWTITEIVEHLILAEQAVLGDATRLHERTPQIQTLASALRFAIVMAVLRLGIRVRVPSETMRPRGHVSFTVLRSQWDSQFELLQTFVLERNRASNRLAIFHHPVAGPLSVTQALWMLEVHLDSHIRQIDRQIHGVRSAR